jgi:hypothetical protein
MTSAGHAACCFVVQARRFGRQLLFQGTKLHCDVLHKFWDSLRILSICPSYAIVCGCMSFCRRIIIICNTDGIVALQIGMMDVISVAVVCKAEGTVLTLYRSLLVGRMVSIGCGGSQQGSKES